VAELGGRGGGAVAPGGATTGAGSHTPAVCRRVFAMSCCLCAGARAGAHTAVRQRMIMMQRVARHGTRCCGTGTAACWRRQGAHQRVCDGCRGATGCATRQQLLHEPLLVRRV
jgi:hypothetical protein